jgi:hypothetical protein
MTMAIEQARRAEDARRMRLLLAEELPAMLGAAIERFVDRLPADVRARLDEYAKAHDCSRVDAVAMLLGKVLDEAK